MLGRTDHGTQQRHGGSALGREVVDAEGGIVHADLIGRFRDLYVVLQNLAHVRALLGTDGVVSEA